MIGANRDADGTELYEQDFVRWTEQQARAIRRGRLDALDREHPTAEIGALGRSDQRAVTSRPAVSMHHLPRHRVRPELGEAFARAIPEGIELGETATGIHAARFESELVTLTDALGEEFDGRTRRRGGPVREESPGWPA